MRETENSGAAYTLPIHTWIEQRYEIVEILGVGGFAITYRAYDSLLFGWVAIKEYFPQSCAERIPGQTEVIARFGENQQRFDAGLSLFKKEAELTASLGGQHNIVAVQGYCEENGTGYIVMEYLKGMTLSEYLKQFSDGYLTNIYDVTRILRVVADGLNFIHLNGILHCDISSDNIFLCDDGSIRIIDFGAAARTTDPFGQDAVVKAGCSPPEQYRKTGRRGPATDLYALGATAYRMLTGSYPEPSPDRQQFRQPLRPASSFNRLVPEYLDILIQRCLALEYGFRIQSAEEMIQILDSETLPASVEQLQKQKKRRQFAAVLGIATCCVILLAATFFALKKTDNLYYAVLRPCTLSICMPDGITTAQGLASLEADFEASFPVDLVWVSSTDMADVFAGKGAAQDCLDLRELRKVLPGDSDILQVVAQNAEIIYGNTEKAAALGESEASLRKRKQIDRFFASSYTDFIKGNDSQCLFIGGPRHYHSLQNDLMGMYFILSATKPEPIYMSVSNSLTAEEEEAALRFLLYLTEERAQEIMFLENDGMLPVNETALNRFFSINQELSDFFDF